MPPPDSLPDRLGRKHALRFSSSLQDLSRFGDPEQPIFNVEFDPPKPSSIGKASFLKERTVVKKNWARIGVCSFFFLLLLSSIFAILTVLTGIWTRKLSNYYVVLDCGSTGTRVFVYEAFVDSKKGNDDGMPIGLRALQEGMPGNNGGMTGRAYKRMETEPGLGKLVRNETGLKSAMMPLIQWAEKQIPRNAHKRTKVFLCATAGVRKLPDPDSKWILDNAWLILRDSAFVCRRDWVRIISGMEEGYYGWIALNYHMGLLGYVVGKETLGALDLGGSSLQITFENEEVRQDENSLNVSIGAVKHHLSAYSLLGYGLNDAFDKSVVHLLKELSNYTIKDLQSGELVIHHPCLQTGYREKYACSLCGAISKETNPGTGEKVQASVPIKLLGAPQWEKCSALAKATVNLSEWAGLDPAIDCDIRPCALYDNLPRPHGHFYAMSGFFVVYKFFNLSSDATLDDMLQKGQEFCEETWEIAKASVAPQPFIEQYCFRAPYVASLLRDGLHVGNDQVIIGSGSVTWTLGVALLEAGKELSSGVQIRFNGMLPRKLDPLALLILSLVSLVLLFLAISAVTNQFHRWFRRGHLPLRHEDATNGCIPSVPCSFSFRGWNRGVSGDARTKLPLSPTVAGSEQQFIGLGHGLGGSGIQLMGSSLYQPAFGIPHSYSSGSLVLENGSGFYRAPGGSKTQLSNRKSLSREDLTSLLATQGIKN